MTVISHDQSTDRMATTATMPAAPADKLNRGRDLLRASGLNDSALNAIMTASDVIDGHKK